MLDLQKTREKIDVIDNQIVELFKDRMELTGEVAAYKIKTGKKVFDKEREAQKLDDLSEKTEDHFHKQAVRELFSQIMSISRKRQYALINEGKSDIPFTKIKDLDEKTNKKVVCFGEKGSYTEQAMEEYFGTEIESCNVNTFKGVLELLKEGKVEYGVLPIENTSTGGITDIYDLLSQYDTCIIGQHVVKVEQALVGLPGAKVENIKKVYSHPQGLMQCEKYLELHPYMEKETFSSTAGGAKKVLEDGDITQAAITSERAAGLYGLEVLQSCINHVNNNYTRFIIVTNKKIYFEDADKVSIYFEIPHKSGSLYQILSHFIYNDLNLTKIESRPMSGRSWEYRFFVEFQGNLQEPGVQNALFGIKEEAVNIKILGNFKC